MSARLSVCPGVPLMCVMLSVCPRVPLMGVMLPCVPVAPLMNVMLSVCPCDPLTTAMLGVLQVPFPSPQKHAVLASAQESEKVNVSPVLGARLTVGRFYLPSMRDLIK